MIESVAELIKKHSSLCRVSRHTEKLEGRKEEIQLLRESLEKKRMKNTIIIGEAGVGKTAIIEELAYKIKDQYTILEFNIPSALSGTKYRGEFEEKMINIMRDIIQFNSRGTRPVILFIDEIHTIMLAGNGENSIDAANILKPFLSRGEITIIGATTPKEYEKTIKKDAALSRRLSAIYINSLDKTTTINILKKFCEDSVEEELLNYIYDKTQNLDTSIELLDRCMARRKCSRKKIDIDMIEKIFIFLSK